MIFLTDITAPLMDYGVLGIFCAIFIVAIAFMAKQFLALHKRNEERILELEESNNKLTDKLEKYLAEDRAAILKTLNDAKDAIIEGKEALKNNTKAFQEMISLMKKIP